MDLIALLWILCKYSLLSLLAFVGYFSYKLIFKQILVKRYYRRFKNVFVEDNVYSVFGDAKKYREDIKNGRVKHYHQIEYALALKGYDFRIFTAGNIYFITLVSQNAFKEFINRVPHFIDRRSMAHRSFGKVCPQSLLFIDSSTDWKNRRDAFMRLMGLNASSKYIGIMLNACEEVISTWKVGSKHNMLQEFNKITFKIITMILFGKDVNEKIGKIDFIEPNGTISKLTFEDYFIRICKDLMSTTMNLPGNLFPFLATYDLIDPFKTNIRNVNSLHKALCKYLLENQDEDSIYYKLTETENEGKDGVNKESSKPRAISESKVHDLIGFLFAGHETSSHTITSALYFLFKNPSTKEKLLKELDEFKGMSAKQLTELLKREKVNELEYLYQVIKETLRVDPPANEALPYECKRDFEMLGVPFKKGDAITVNILSQHYNQEQWKEPKKFLPERFDPESPYYSLPEQDGKRSPLSYLPFSVGIRNCPGQVLALLETKILLIYFLSNIDYEIDKDILENEYAYFAVISQFKCEFTVKNKIARN